MKMMHNEKGTVRGASLLAAAAALFITAPSQADNESPRYTMTAIVDSSFGRAVTSGRYQQAIEKITARQARTRETFESQNNLCVAYTKVGDLDSASVACDQAVAEMRKRTERKSPTRRGQYAEFSRSDRVYLAVALTNRGVLHAVNGDLENARRDFAEAAGIDVDISQPQINLSRLLLDNRRGG